jgi:hypothetical protein
MLSYKIEILEDGRCKVTAQYIGSNTVTVCKNFSAAVELIETWYREDLNFSKWGKIED